MQIVHMIGTWDDALLKYTWRIMLFIHVMEACHVYSAMKWLL